MTPTLQRGSAAAQVWLGAVLEDGPWRSKTVIAALLAVLIGMGLWVKDALDDKQRSLSGASANASSAEYRSGRVGLRRPVPGYVRVGVSYIGGFLLGWTFRRFVKIAALATVLVVGVLGLAKFAGCDNSDLRVQVAREATTVTETVKRERDHLKHLLPSATAAGIGVFWGFRRRSRRPPKS